MDIVAIIAVLFLIDGLLFSRLVIQHHFKIYISIIIIFIIDIIVIIILFIRM